MNSYFSAKESLLDTSPFESDATVDSQIYEAFRSSKAGCYAKATCSA